MLAMCTFVDAQEAAHLHPCPLTAASIAGLEGRQTPMGHRQGPRGESLEAVMPRMGLGPCPQMGSVQAGWSMCRYGTPMTEQAGGELQSLTISQTMPINNTQHAGWLRHDAVLVTGRRVSQVPCNTYLVSEPHRGRSDLLEYWGEAPSGTALAGSSKCSAREKLFFTVGHLSALDAVRRGKGAAQAPIWGLQNSATVATCKVLAKGRLP